MMTMMTGEQTATASPRSSSRLIAQKVRGYEFVRTTEVGLLLGKHSTGTDFHIKIHPTELKVL